MQTLSAFYFSGTGNTKYVTQTLCQKLAERYTARLYDVCDPIGTEAFSADVFLFAFPIYGSCPPLPMTRFVHASKDFLPQKPCIVVAVQYMFSGDGAASLGRTVEKYGGQVRFAEHFRMPNNLSDCTVFSVKNGEDLHTRIEKTNKRICAFAEKILSDRPFRRGFNPVSHAVGYLCQRALFRRGFAKKQNLVRIDPARCVRCGLCVRRCPVHNLRFEDARVTALGNCVLCYRCVNLCPRQAIGIIGKNTPKEPYRGVPND